MTKTNNINIGGMMNRRILKTVVALTVLATPAYAGMSWSTSVNRGMQTYKIENEAAKVQLVCDPDRVFGGASNASLHVDFGTPETSSNLVLLSESGEQAPLTIDSDGFAFEVKQKPADWKKMVKMIEVGGSYAFVTSHHSAEFQKVQPIDGLRC